LKRRLLGWVAHPATVVFAGAILLVGLVIAYEGGDPLSLARLGTYFSQGVPNGSAGYDGQFVYYIARDPRPQVVASYLDVPAYRYQRILLPLLSRWLAWGSEKALPWTLILVGIISHTFGTWAVTKLLEGWGVNRWYSLVYGFWVGFLLALRLDLPEPLAYALIAGGYLALERGQRWLGWSLLGLALFAKEVTIIFVAACLISAASQWRWDEFAGLILVTLFPWGVFQIWLWQIYGQFGLASGGYMATPFEMVPFMGFLRIGFYSPFYLLAMALVFVPSVILPSLWGVYASIKKWLSGEQSAVVLALFLNSLAMAFLPFSTYRETGGLLRFACGLVLAMVLFAARFRLRKVLNYSLAWMVLNAFLFKG